tara:strand:+ start:508 stop:1110 length:603 start_codon:yes stop_codon:yes gene_type:complete
VIKIAVTGNIGSGKTTICGIIKNLGFKVFESDQEVKEILEEKEQIQSLLKEFHLKIPGLINNNKIDKEKLGDFVFSNPTELKKLENLIHPKVWKRKEEFLLKHKNEKLIFFDVPILFEKKLENNFDFIIYTKISKDIQKQRVLKRKNMNEKKFNLITMSQNILTAQQKKLISLELETSSDESKIELLIRNFLKKIQDGKK